MKRPLHLDPAAASEELLRFNDRLARCLDAIAASGPADVGASPREEILRDGPVRLYRYQSSRRTPGAAPLLVCYALVNRPYMADLQADRSLIAGLLARGRDVYLIDWGYPGPADRALGLEDYVDGYLRRALERLCRDHDLPAVDLLGICQGGVFSLCLAALHPQRVRRLVTMVTPVDFHTPDNVLARLVREVDVDLLVDTLGNVPGSLLNALFLALNPFRLASKKYLDLVHGPGDAEQLQAFLRMERWIFDCPDQAGQAFREFAREFFIDNGLVSGRARIGSRRVDLGRIRAPLLNLYASRDHIVPPAATQALRGLYRGTEYREQVFDGGHIGIYVSARAQREVPAAIAAWLERD